MAVLPCAHGQEYQPVQPLPAFERQPPQPPVSELDAIFRRLEETENRLRSLEMERLPMPEDEKAAESKEDDKDKKKEESKEDDKKEESKEKKWYERLNLRGYAQFRYNYVTHTEPGSAIPQHAGDSSIGPDQEFLIRRARLIFSGDVSEHLYVYMQPDFASTPNGSTDAIYFSQIRDWYGDIYFDTDKVFRLRVGQSKIPYGWENLQSSQNRMPLDRNDAFNSATRNERDLGVFFYWTPEWAQETFKYVMDENLKGSGNYGVFAFGAYNGQGGSLREFNDELHLVSRLTLPITFENGQIMEVGIQGYVGRYVVLGSPIRPLGVGPLIVPDGTYTSGSPDGVVDNRLGWSLIYYPQPLGFQAEWTIGEGPALNAEQTAVVRRSLDGGYAMVNYKHETDCYGTWFPYARWQYYTGGYKSARNAPYSYINELDLGIEWQIRKELELVCEYVFTDRTNLSAMSNGESYGQFDGQVLRLQCQINY